MIGTKEMHIKYIYIYIFCFLFLTKVSHSDGFYISFSKKPTIKTANFIFLLFPSNFLSNQPYSKSIPPKIETMQ